MSDEERAELIKLATTGLVYGTLIQSYQDVVKVLRSYAGSEIDKRLDELEARAIRTVENAPIDSLLEAEQLFVVESARKIVHNLFTSVKTG